MAIARIFARKRGMRMDAPETAAVKIDHIHELVRKVGRG